MKYNYWTSGEIAVLRVESATGRMNMQDPTPQMKRVMRRHSRKCISAVATYLRRGGRFRRPANAETQETDNG